jgi:hypothetical protein
MEGDDLSFSPGSYSQRKGLRASAPSARGRPLFIGSLPFQDHNRALDEVILRAPETPHWVQLPSNEREGFLVQFCEGLPGFRTSPKTFVDNAGEAFDQELLDFYQDYLQVTEGGRPLEGSRFGLSPDFVPGLYTLLERYKGSRLCFVKGQISGPVSVLLGLYDASGRCAYYDERLKDAAVKLLALKASRQVQMLSSLAHHCLVSVDEPALGGLGSSAYISISDQEALGLVDSVVRAIQQEGGWAAIHVCANADWGTLLDLDMDVLSFDAFSYFDRVVLFREKILSFLINGGVLAWGIVPTSMDDLDQLLSEDLVERWMAQGRELLGGQLDLKKLLERTFITPSCGLGSLDEAHALKAMDLTADVSKRLQGLLL